MSPYFSLSLIDYFNWDTIQAGCRENANKVIASSGKMGWMKVTKIESLESLFGHKPGDAPG